MTSDQKKDESNVRYRHRRR